VTASNQVKLKPGDTIGILGGGQLGRMLVMAAARLGLRCQVFSPDPDSPAFKDAEKLRSEWVVRIDGKVRRRPDGTDNPELPTGAVELYVSAIEVLGPAGELPLPVFGEQEYPEDIRLKYRFLDLRREKLSELRESMERP